MNPQPALARAPEPAANGPASASQPALAADRDRSLIHSVFWNAAGDWLSQIISWAAFLVVLRLVPPADFGIAAMAVLLLPYMSLIAAFGIPRAVVTLPDLSSEQLAQLNSVSFFIAIGWFVCVLAIARPFASFFHEPKLAPVLVVASVSLIIIGIQGVPAAILAKECRFRLLTILGAVGAVVAAIATLVLAISGFGYWALVLGNLLGFFCRSVLILRVQPCRFAWPRLQTIREPLRFGSRIMVSMLASNSYSNLDNFVAGRMLGDTALGLYGTAWEFANLPVEKIATLVTTVLPSYLSAVRNDPARLRAYLGNITETLALATFPATVGLGLVAPEVVPWLLGSRWTGVIAPLQVLSFYAGFRSIAALLPRFLVAVGDVTYTMWNDVAGLLLLPCAFYLGSRHGIAGIAWGWVLGFPLIALPLYRRTLRALRMSVSEYMARVRPALEGTLLMIPGVLLVKRTMGASLHSIPLLICEVAIGAAVYLGVLALRHRDRLGVLIDLGRKLLSRPGSSEANATA